MSPREGAEQETKPADGSAAKRTGAENAALPQAKEESGNGTADCAAAAAAAANATSSYSLVNPNLDGLWSCALLKDSDPRAALRGALPLLCLCGSWSLGPFLPLLAVHWLRRGALGGDNADSQGDLARGTALLLLLSYPYIMPVRPRPWAARFWLSAASYFEGGCSMSYEERDVDDLSVPQIQCYHPHGIFTLGLILNSGIRSSAAEHDVGSDRWKRYVGRAGRVPFVGLAAETLVQMPVFRHIMVKWTGNIESASKGHMVSKMKRGECFGITPGGFHEVSLFVRGRERVYVKKTGFIYYALKYGYVVTPAYTFGECRTFYNVPGGEGWRARLAELGVPAILITGPWSWIPFLALLPFRRGVGLHTVHGRGRKFPRIDEPTKEQVAEYHRWYCRALTELFERHKGRFGITHELEIIE